MRKIVYVWRLKKRGFYKKRESNQIANNQRKKVGI